MKYRDLIEYHPITEVVQLCHADQPLMATELVRDFVASKDMVDIFTKVIYPNIQFSYFNDNKALMIIGNYGTGKSHMMSVISAVAENNQNVSCFTNQTLADASQEIAGKFKVVRLEVGGVSTPLDTIILKNEMERHLKDWGVKYTFPDFLQISTYKDCLQDMMAAFNKKYPDMGILIVIDELLEYLKAKNDSALYKELGFFRQLCEFCQGSKLRVMVGMQESVFDSPKFKFAADIIGKIKDRTQIVYIKKDDIKFVVAERLLKKNANQKAQIRNYLSKFKPYYPNLTTEFEKFVDLFPLHPSYIDSFTNMVRVEKREVLKSVSNELRSVLDKDIPENSLELITIDNYWKTFENDATQNTYQGIKEIKDCNRQLQSKIEYLKPSSYVPLAKRIVDALSIQRLYFDDVNTPIGVSSRELKDSLCLYSSSAEDMGGDDEAMLTIVDTILGSIMKAVNGQYIDKTAEGYYFININKAFDFDQHINAKIELLTDDDKNRAFFNLLKDLLEQSDDATAFMSNKIWPHELQFLGKNMYRNGWLFFGIPDERPTAVPEKDFYIFFVPPFNTPRYKDSGKIDELVVKLKNSDSDFEAELKYYAATMDLANSSSSTYKSTYLNKADAAKKKLNVWMNNHFFDAFSITYDQKTKTLSDWMARTSVRDVTGIRSEVIPFKERFDSVAALCLKPSFEQIAPGYPEFTIKLSGSNINSTLQTVFRNIVTGVGLDKTSLAVLNGLKLVDNGKIRPRQSEYAKYILARLDEKSDDVVLRSDELMEEVHSDFYCLKDSRIESQFVSIILASLVYSGDVVVTCSGKNYDAANMKDLLGVGVEGLQKFSSIKKPKDWNVSSIKALLDVFDLPEGLFTSIKNGDDGAIQTIQAKNAEIISTLAKDAFTCKNGLDFFGMSVSIVASGIDDHKAFIDDLKKKMEDLSKYKSCGMLKNLRTTTDEFAVIKASLIKEKVLVNYYAEIKNLNEYYTWLEAAKSNLPLSHQWVISYEEKKIEAIEKVSNWKIESIAKIKTDFDNLKSSYVHLYSAMHSKARLSGKSSLVFNSILNSDEYKRLNKLMRISILPATKLDGIRSSVESLKECPNLTEQEILKSPICPHCGYSPRQQGEEDASFKLSQVREQIDELLESWNKTLLSNLKDPSVKESIALMDSKKQDCINTFVSEKVLPDDLSDYFINTVNEALNGLVKKPLKKETIFKTLLGDGKPLSVKELKDNFDKLIAEISANGSEDKIRIVLE